MTKKIRTRDREDDTAPTAEEITDSILQNPINVLRLFEDQAQTVHMVDNKDLQCVVQAWSNCDVEFTPPNNIIDRLSDDDTNGSCDVLWQYCRFDIQELSTKAGLALGKTEVWFEVAKGNLLIYPDGTVNEEAKAFLRGEVRKYLKRM